MYLARGNGAAGNGGTQNRAGNANACQEKLVKCYNCNGTGHIARNCTQPKRPQNSNYFKDKMLLMQAQENGAVLDEEELLFLAGEQVNTFDVDVDNQPVQDLALNEDNIFQVDECDTFDSDVEDEPTTQSIFMANLSSAGSANPQVGTSNASILSEAKESQRYYWMVKKPSLRIIKCRLMVIVPSSEEDLELAETTRNKLHAKMNDSACCGKRDILEPKKPVTSSDAPSFDSLFMIGKLNEQIQSRGNTICELKEKISCLTKKNSDADPIFDLKALVSQNKDLTAKLNALHDLNEPFGAVNAKAQLKDYSKYVTIPDSKPKLLPPSRYPIDVEPIPPRHKNNPEVHLHYIKHLKENVETLREIVEDVKVVRPLDTSITSACRYTKHSQELLEYVIGTYPKDLSPSNKQNASTSSLRKKRVTFVEPCETLTHNTPPQVEHQKINLTNAPGIPSTGVKGTLAASRSKPRSNTKKDRTLPVKSALKQVEAHSRMNKSNEKQKNYES
ncbi:retrovirus-related pol polyprotein from transposon TNT 1-94 [Tanacetum coccineum]